MNKFEIFIGILFYMIKSLIYNILHILKNMYKPVDLLMKWLCFFLSILFLILKKTFSLIIIKKIRKIKKVRKIINIAKIDENLKDENMCYHKYLPRRFPRDFLMKDRLSVVLTDIQKSTMMWNINSDSMYKLVTKHNKVARNLCDKFEGLEIKNEGDSFLMLFRKFEQAVGFSTEFSNMTSKFSLKLKQCCWIKNGLKLYEKKTKKMLLKIRIGINEGIINLITGEMLDVDGFAVKKTYDLLNHTPKIRSICIYRNLMFREKKMLGKNVKYCVHNI